MSIDSLRKSNSVPFGGAFVAEYIKDKHIDVPDSFIEQMEMIRKEKQKLSDERTASVSTETAAGTKGTSRYHCGFRRTDDTWDNHGQKDGRLVSPRNLRVRDR